MSLSKYPPAQADRMGSTQETIAANSAGDSTRWVLGGMSRDSGWDGSTERQRASRVNEVYSVGADTQRVSDAVNRDSGGR